MKKSSQVIRAQSYSVSKIQGILDEATRLEEACKHVEDPKPPTWWVGGREVIEQAVTDYMQTKQQVHMPDGTIRERKQNKDARCMVAGFASYPMPMSKMNKDNAADVKKWAEDTVEFLKKKFGKKLKGVCLHFDEGYPHLHYFVVGNAQRLHPGLKAEVVGVTRIADPIKRGEAYRAGLKTFLDDYHAEVGAKHGLARSLGKKPAWRVKDRAVKSKLFEVDKKIKELETTVQAAPAKPEALKALASLVKARDEVYDTQPKHTVKMKF
jgi:hypothetical protein